MKAINQGQLEIHQEISRILDKIYTASHYEAEYMDKQDTARVNICRRYITNMNDQVASLKALLIHA